MLEKENAGRWAYLCLMRPPMPGSIPRCGLDYIECREGYSKSGHHYWGKAVYTRELTKEEVYNYKLEETELSVTD